MHESDSNRLKKRQRALLLAAEDRTQAIAAARALQEAHLELESPDSDALVRALETAMVVSYMRAFTTSTLLTLNDYVPTAGTPEADAHAELDRLRDKVYAHTDKDGERKAMFETEEVRDSGHARVRWWEKWDSFDVDKLPEVIRLFESQRHLMRLEFAEIQKELGHPPPEWI